MWQLLLEKFKIQMNQAKSAEPRYILFCMTQNWNMFIFFDRDGWFCANGAFTDFQKSYT